MSASSRHTNAVYLDTPIKTCIHVSVSCTCVETVIDKAAGWCAYIYEALIDKGGRRLGELPGAGDVENVARRHGD